MSEQNNDSSIFMRQTCTREDLSQRFSAKVEQQYKKQYAHIYYMRNQLMNERIEKAARTKWGDDVVINKLSDVSCGVKCCVTGTLFKVMELQPSILKEISDENHIPLQPPRSRFTCENDRLVLEDALQRISLVGNIVPDESFTGSVIAVYGAENESGQFDVEDYTYSGMPLQSQLPVPAEENRYVLLVSGLGIGGKKEKSMQLQLLIDYIIGMLGGPDDHELCSKIVHVIIAGNSLSNETLDKDSQKKAKYLTYKSEASSVTAIRDLDYFLSQLVPYISVDLMSGEYDLSNFILPQKPMHYTMFPSASRYRGSTFHTASNPYECKIDGVHFLGTSGQNINNLKAYSTVTDGIRLLSDTLECQHLAPTAPDTLGCFPFYDTDPFIINDCPHVYFCGNQPKFDSKMVEGTNGQNVLLVCVPDFNKTTSAVLCNLKTLMCEKVCVDVQWDQRMDEGSPEK